MNKGTKQYKKLSMILVFALIIGLFPTRIISAETENSAVVSGTVQNSAIQEDMAITPTIETGMVESPSIEMTPQPMVPTATPESTMVPTATPEETLAPEETITPVPTLAPEPTAVPEETVMPMPGPTLIPEETLAPTPEPTQIPEETVVPEPTQVPQTEAPTPVVTAEPTVAPVPTTEPTVGPPLPPTAVPTIPPVADSTVLSNPTIQNTITTWDYVTFGHAMTETGDVTTPLYWRVLSVKNGEMLLMADKTIATASYDDADHLNWKDSSLRQWMNAELINQIFSEDEQEDILYTVNENAGNEFGEATDEEATLDQLFLPSMTEVCREEYGFSDLLVENAMSRVCKMANGTSVDWWLRTAGYTSEQASYVTAAGSVQYTGEDKGEVKGVRPMLRVRVSSAYWRYVGKIQSDGKILFPVVVTPPPVPSAPTTNTGGNSPASVVTVSPTQAPVVTIAPVSSNKKVKKPAKVTWKKNKKKAGKKIKLSWKKVKASKGYQVRYAKKASFKKAKTKTTNKTFITMKKQKSKYTFVQVRAYRLDGKKKVYGAWSKVKKIQWK